MSKEIDKCITAVSQAILGHESLLTTESLTVRILNPSLDHTLIDQVFKLFENEQADHQPDGFGRTVGSRVKQAEIVLEHLPWNYLGQFQKTIPRIKLSWQIGQRKLGCLTGFLGSIVHNLRSDFDQKTASFIALLVDFNTLFQFQIKDEIMNLRKVKRKRNKVIIFTSRMIWKRNYSQCIFNLFQ